MWGYVSKKGLNYLTPEELNGATLAYLGDAVFELMVREKVIESGYSNLGKLNELARNFVQATEQSKAVSIILEYLDEEELSFYKRGKNAKLNHPKSASASEYSRATGLETLFAFLYMKGRRDRLDFLFKAAYGEILDTLKNN